MRAVFGYIALTLALATFVAWRITDNKNVPGKIVMTWVTDDNPTRRDQIALFNKKYPQYELRLDANNQGIDKKESSSAESKIKEHEVLKTLTGDFDVLLHEAKNGDRIFCRLPLRWENLRK